MGADSGNGPGVARKGQREAEGEFRPGDAVPGAGRRVVRVIGRGAHATVYEVTNEAGCSIALKVLHAHLAEREGMAERLLNEAKALAQLNHPNIVKVFRVGSTSGPPPRPFVEMELLSGKDARQLLAVGTLDVEMALDILTEVASALGAAHSAGIVHQDLKLDNLFAHVDPKTGRLTMKLLDFGVARAVGESAPEGVFEGTVEYAAPEQLSFDAPVTPRSDLYALGVIAFELLTARRPYFDAEDYDREQEEQATARGERSAEPFDLEVIRAKLSLEAPRLSGLVEIPRAFDALVASLLSIDPSGRPESAAEVEAALRAVRQGAPERHSPARTESVLLSKFTGASSPYGTVAPRVRAVPKRNTVLPTRAPAAPRTTTEGADGAGPVGRTVVGMGVSRRESERTGPATRPAMASNRPREIAVASGVIPPRESRERTAQPVEGSGASPLRVGQLGTVLMISETASRDAGRHATELLQTPPSNLAHGTELMPDDRVIPTAPATSRGATEFLDGRRSNEGLAPATALRHGTVAVAGPPLATMPMPIAGNDAAAARSDGSPGHWNRHGGAFARPPEERSGAGRAADTVEQLDAARSDNVGGERSGDLQFQDDAPPTRMSARLPLLVAAAGVGLLLVGGGLGLALTSKGSPAPTASPSPVVTAPSAPPSAATVVRVVAVAPVEAEPTAPARVVPEAPESRPLPTREPVVLPPPHGVRARPATDTPPRARPEGARPAPNCSPNFTVNDAGMKHFKAECFQ